MYLSSPPWLEDSSNLGGSTITSYNVSNVGKYSKSKKKELNDNKRDFYLSFFNEDSGYDEKEVNGWLLIKQWDGNYERWTVHLYSEASYRSYKRGLEKYQEQASFDDLSLIT